jgi:transposase-like protein
MTELPPSNTRRWVARRKAAVVAAVSSGVITIEEACHRYHVSEEEFFAWRRAFENFGIRGLPCGREASGQVALFRRRRVVARAVELCSYAAQRPDAYQERIAIVVDGFGRQVEESERLLIGQAELNPTLSSRASEGMDCLEFVLDESEIGARLIGLAQR